MPNTQLTDKTLDVLEALAVLRTASLPQVQELCRAPMTTTYRIIQSLMQRGYVMRAARGHYQLGTSVITIARQLDIRDLLSAAARSPLKELSKKARCHAHLGVLEHGMVTYLVKQAYGKAHLLSVEGAQLEAYCSALGKVLLSGLPDDELSRYVAEDALVSLTPNTITDPGQLQSEINMVRARGWAEDREEIALGLRCLAAPIRDHLGTIVAAVSISVLARTAKGAPVSLSLPLLGAIVAEIEEGLFPRQMKTSVHQGNSPPFRIAAGVTAP